MILYTPVPQELIYPEEQSAQNQITVEIQEGQLVLEQVSMREFRVVRLLSTDPNAFLNENYTPGKMISLF
ncbi:hypothetical protein DS745_16500 [Anaerobacillus alkaliphilus]|uniref:Uncharacterized protein n=1 Tax=Anaerobacillus alkaliphilus TaxID=1548597 RepID=A0A4Q0VPF7_9BACI|nr:YlzJ-like family protein [Anaerobacillus alkaliphilus]RXI97951.1 hypothetical protein DS745_16500 [Anaerobacillus alkaliphilus]